MLYGNDFLIWPNRNLTHVSSESLARVPENKVARRDDEDGDAQETRLKIKCSLALKFVLKGQSNEIFNLTHGYKKKNYISVNSQQFAKSLDHVKKEIFWDWDMRTV